MKIIFEDPIKLFLIINSSILFVLLAYPNLSILHNLTLLFLINF